MSDTMQRASAVERTMRSPRIAGLAWGQIEIEGVGTFRDAKAFPGGAREWDWHETGCAQIPGILPAAGAMRLKITDALRKA